MTYFARASKAGPIAAALLSVVLPAAPARAAEAGARAPVVQSVIDCRKIQDSAERLTCFDGAVAKMQEAEDRGDLVSVDRQQRTEARRQAFGFNLPSLGFLNRGENSEEVDRVTFKVDSAWQITGGKWVVKMAGGAVWRQIDDTVLYRSPRNNSTAELRKGALGSFFMKVDDQTAIRVHRDN